MLTAHAFAAWLLFQKARGLPPGHAEHLQGPRGAVSRENASIVGCGHATVGAGRAPAPPALPPAASQPGHPAAAAIEALQDVPPPLQQPQLPLPLEESSWEWVDCPARLAAAVEELLQQGRVALDLEHHSQHSYTGVTCLIQLSTGKHSYLGEAACLLQLRHLPAPALHRQARVEVVGRRALLPRAM